MNNMKIAEKVNTNKTQTYKSVKKNIYLIETENG